MVATAIRVLGRNCLEWFFEEMQIRRRKSQPGEIISSGQRSLWLYTEPNVQDDAWWKYCSVASSNNLTVADVFKGGWRGIMSSRTSLFGESLKALEALQQDCATNSLITTVRNSSTNFCGKWQFLWFLHCALVYFSELVQYFVFLLMEIKRGWIYLTWKFNSTGLRIGTE